MTVPDFSFYTVCAGCETCPSGLHTPAPDTELPADFDEYSYENFVIRPAGHVPAPRVRTYL